jgi:hypothetical protein
VHRRLLGDGMLNVSDGWMAGGKNAEKRVMLDLINKVHVCLCVYTYIHTYIMESRETCDAGIDH